MTQTPTLPHTKIVATIGPATDSVAAIDALLNAGMRVARINCAHSAGDQLARMVDRLRVCAERTATPLAILADLGGPKLRIGRFQTGAVEVARGETFILTTADVLGTAERVSVNHPALPREVRPGEAIYLNDGLIALEVTGTSETEVHTRVEVGGELSDLKGLNAPTANLTMSTLTVRDELALDRLAACGVDYVGLSFVRSEADLARLREALAARRATTAIVAKIERAQAIDRLDAIVRSADAVMVARGDLGVECRIEEVPVLQKRIIQRCNQMGVPVITATQMLESMVSSARPTRAEASDVANAVLDGTDAVMLSAETAVGRHPIEAVRVMSRILSTSEAFARRDAARLLTSPADDAGTDAGAAIGRSACMAAHSVRAQAIVCLTQSGTTARQVARWRPEQPVLAVTPRPETGCRLALVWGVEPILAEEFDTDFDAACMRIIRRLREQGRLSSARPVVVTAGLPFARRRGTNTVRIETLE